jgi:hypothetical protein
MSHIHYTTTDSTNPNFFWSLALDQSPVAPCTDGCTALLTGTGIGHDYGHHIGTASLFTMTTGGGGGHGNGHGNGHGDDDCVPAPGALVLLALAAAVIAKRCR